MLSKKTIVALILVAVQGVLLFVANRSQSKKTTATSALAPISASAIHKLTLTKGAGTVELERVEAAGASLATSADGGPPPADANWKLTKPVAYAADKGLVKSLLERLEKMTVSGEAISRKTEWHDDKFGVGDKTGTKVTLFNKDGGTLSTFIFGKSEGGRTFLRKPGEDAVYQATGIMSVAFDKKPSEWRDKTIFELKEDDLARIEIRRPEGVALARDPQDAKKWIAGEPAGMKLDAQKVAGLTRTFATLRAKEFGEGDKAEATGLDRPETMVVATTKAGKQHTLLVGKKKGQDHYVKRAGSDTVFVIGSYQAEQLLRKASELKEKEPVIAKPEAALVQAIKLVTPAGKVSLARTGAETWRITEPLAEDADAAGVQAIFAEIQKMNVPETTHGGKEKHAEYQLDQKGTRVELTGAGGKTLTSFVIGKEDKGQTYVRKAGDDKVHKTYGLARVHFEKGAAAWKSKASPAPAPRKPGDLLKTPPK